MRGKRRESCAPLRSNLMKIAILSLSKGRPPEALATIPSEYARRHFNYAHLRCHVVVIAQLWLVAVGCSPGALPD